MSKFNVTLNDQGPWLLDLDTMLNSEAEQCEALTGWTHEQWRDALIENRARAVKFAVWLARSRSEDPVAWGDFDFDLADLDWELVDEPDVEQAPADLGVGEDDLAAVPTGHPERSGDQG